MLPVHPGVSIACVECDGFVFGVRLDDRALFATDIDVLTCGIQMDVDLAQTTGSDCCRAVKVILRTGTSAPDVYAYGDCAKTSGANFQLWAKATERGRVAGPNAASDRETNMPQILSL